MLDDYVELEESTIGVIYYSKVNSIFAVVSYDELIADEEEFLYGNDWYKPHVAQSSIGEITVDKSHFYTLDEESYIEIDGSRIYKIPLKELIDDNRINAGESNDYFRFEYNGERYMLLFGEAASLYYNSDPNTKPVFIEKLNFVVVK